MCGPWGTSCLSRFACLELMIWVIFFFPPLKRQHDLMGWGLLFSWWFSFWSWGLDGAGVLELWLQWRDGGVTSKVTGATLRVLSPSSSWPTGQPVLWLLAQGSTFSLTLHMCQKERELGGVHGGLKKLLLPSFSCLSCWKELEQVRSRGLEKSWYSQNVPI